MAKTVYSEVRITPSTTQYTANDNIGGLLTLPLRGVAYGTGRINSLLITDNDNEGAAGALWLFNARPTALADNAAFLPTFDDLKKVVAVVTLPTFVTVNSLRVGVVEDIDTMFRTVRSPLYAYLVPSATPTYATSREIYIRLGIVTD